jgi:hypothetical protein
MSVKEATPVDASGRVAEVLRLGLVEGVAVRAIAKRLHMSRKTVRKILGRQRAPPKPAAEARGSILDPYEPAIRSVLDDAPEMLAPAVLERLRPLGYTGGVTILRDRLRRLRPRGPRTAFLTLDFAPGEAMQVDWADFDFALPGVPRRVSAFVAVLCYSRRLYIEFTVMGHRPGHRASLAQEGTARGEAARRRRAPSRARRARRHRALLLQASRRRLASRVAAVPEKRSRAASEREYGGTAATRPRALRISGFRRGHDGAGEPTCQSPRAGGGDGGTEVLHVPGRPLDHLGAEAPAGVVRMYGAEADLTGALVGVDGERHAELAIRKRACRPTPS